MKQLHGMKQLTEQFAGLAQVPWIDLGRRHAPLHKLQYASTQLGAALWVKREDQNHPVYAGNKLRKLEILLADAKRRGATDLVTSGALGSHHVLATAVHGRALGFSVHAVVVPQQPTADLQSTLKRVLSLQTHTIRAAHPICVPPQSALLMRRLVVQRRVPYLVPPGGTNPLSSLGHMALGYELAAEIAADSGNTVDEVVVPVGSSGTVAGIAIGLALYARMTNTKMPTVRAVRVVDHWLMPEFWTSALIARTCALLSTLEPRVRQLVPDLSRFVRDHIIHDCSQLGAGYTHLTADAMAAREVAARDGLHLETTYSAKAFACMLERSNGDAKSRVFIHTYSAV